MTLTVPGPPLASPLPWVHGLARHGSRVALHSPAGSITYAALAAQVDRVAATIAGSRRLVHVIGGNDHASVVALLAAQAVGHVVLLTAAGTAAARLDAAYGPDVVLRAGDGPASTADPDVRIEVRRERSAHVLHPDLALLLSTSGSTGAAKVVRLSVDNLAANAEQIIDGLDIRADDCAALTLPLTYCYGLSVLTTHLSMGASVMLTEASVVDECFWQAAYAAGVTTFPGVPHTFELLERSGFAERDLPAGFRYLTQAGGRMDPDRVRRFAELGEQRGFDLLVMYGQCEATARMAIQPAHLSAKSPDTVGFSVSGGRFEIVDEEIVFHGPNVMLGYAEKPADLALGRTVSALHTGDTGIITDDGTVRITGRRSRFVKVLGHRVDLDVLEQRLRDDGMDARVAGQDGRITIAARGRATEECTSAVHTAAVHHCGAPPDAVSVVAVDEFPLLDNGKLDYATVHALGAAGPATGPVAMDSIHSMYAEILRCEVGPEDTFVGLGGDSLSYVEASIRVEDLLGELPDGWHLQSVAELDRRRAAHQAARAGVEGEPTQRRRFRWQAVESSIWLRAMAIIFIVGTHSHLFALQGTANALLGVAGYQMARFQLTRAGSTERTKRLLTTATRMAAPALLVIVTAHLVGGYYETRNLFLANWIFGQEHLGPPWRFWFIEAMVVALLVVAALTRWTRFNRLEGRHPLMVPLALSIAAWGLFRIPWFDLPTPRMQGSALIVLHLFLLGWALARANSPGQRVVASTVTLVMVGTFSWNPQRDALTAFVLLILLWVPVTRMPSPVVPLVRVLASASLYIYVIHWQALELLRPYPVPAFIASLALGIAYWLAWTRGAEMARRVRNRAATRESITVKATAESITAEADQPSAGPQPTRPASRASAAPTPPAQRVG